MEAPFIYRRPCGNGSTEDAAIMAALEGDLGRLKGFASPLLRSPYPSVPSLGCLALS